MRSLTCVLLLVALAAVPLAGQQGPTPCSEYLALDESRRSTLALGMAMGYAVATGLAGRMLKRVESDTTDKAMLRSLIVGVRPDADRDSLNRALDEVSSKVVDRPRETGVS